MKTVSGSLLCISVLALAGCSAIATKTNMLDDDKIRSQSAGVLGYEPADLTVVTRRTEGTNTYATLKARDGKEFTCLINGGNLLTMGLTNPPMCSRKGEPIKASPFQR